MINRSRPATSYSVCISSLRWPDPGSKRRSQYSEMSPEKPSPSLVVLIPWSNASLNCTRDAPIRPASSSPPFRASAMILPAMEWTKSASTESWSAARSTNSILTTTFPAGFDAPWPINGYSCSISMSLLSSFPQLSMHSLHDTLWYSQSGVSPLEPGFSALPFEYSGLVGENAADCSFAQAPQLGEFTHTIVPLESDAGRRRGTT